MAFIHVKNMDFQKCVIMSGFRKSGHIFSWGTLENLFTRNLTDEYFIHENFPIYGIF